MKGFVPYNKRMKKLLFYGDSNTYGYDPADFFGGPYPHEKMWTTILAEKLQGKYEILNYGENGRRIPDIAGGYEYPAKLLSLLKKDDVFAVMLGANDLLITSAPMAEVPIRKMEQFISWLLRQEDHPILLLIAPPTISSKKSPDPYMQRAFQESVRMNEGYAKLAKQQDLWFVDTTSWKIPYAFDEVHFTEEGHRRFAEEMFKELQEGLENGTF